MAIALFARIERGPAMGLVRANDGAHEFVPHNVALGKVNRRNSRNVL
jgi:hypothetical protein